jgi:hypothetical protein
MRNQNSRNWALPLAAAAGLALAAGCGPAQSPDDASVASSGDALKGSNGLGLNGLSQNGLSQNGLSQNGLSQNGLSQNGLSSASFGTWFSSDPALGNAVMTYVARCALNRSQSLSYTFNGKTYTWPGNLGLAPVWASGRKIPVAEQQLMTACLAAHVNKFGVTVALSVRGYLSDGRTPIPLDPNEDKDYAYDEACFFGNLFTSQGIFLGADQASFNPTKSTPRGCAVEAGTPGVCPPMQHVGLCKDFCTKSNSKNLYYGDCLVNGTHFRPLHTFLSTNDVYLCGDNICQISESIFDPVTRTGCLKDCGSL